MNFILDCIKGIAIGAGAILPGVSSGVLCVVFGIYEKLVDSILNFFKDIKNNIKFLFPILIGGIIGVVLFGNVLRYLFENFFMPTCFCFIGIIIGGIPTLFRNANLKSGFRLHYLIYTIFTFSLTIFLLYIEKNFTSLYTSNNFLFLILSGFTMSIGVIVPGVSSTVILMLMGTYDTYLFAISTINLPILVPMGIGLLIGGYIFLNITKFMLENYYTQTYYAIIGFVLGAIPILYPGLSFDFIGIISIICFILGFYISKILEKTH